MLKRFGGLAVIAATVLGAGASASAAPGGLGVGLPSLPSLPIGGSVIGGQGPSIHISLPDGDFSASIGSVSDAGWTMTGGPIQDWSGQPPASAKDLAPQIAGPSGNGGAAPSGTNGGTSAVATSNQNSSVTSNTVGTGQSGSGTGGKTPGG